MRYYFIDKYCELTLSPEPNITIHLSGWITYADSEILLLTDEEGDEIPIHRNDLVGSIVVPEREGEISKLPLESILS